MPMIRPISDLRININEISEYVKRTHQPVFVTKNGVGDMVLMSMEDYDKLISPSAKSVQPSPAPEMDESSPETSL